MKTLLSPAVLHVSSLKDLQSKPLQFFKSYIVKFAYIQAILFSLLWIIFFAQIVFPFGKMVQSYSEQLLTRANFSSVSFHDGVMDIDILPDTWTYSLENSEEYQYVVAVDDTGKMNPYYWDDRFIGGTVKVMDGIGIMKDHVFIKTGNSKTIYPYSKIFGSKNAEFTKGEVRNIIQKYSSTKAIAIYLLLSLPIIFILSGAFGAAFQVLFSYTVGIIIAMLTTKVESYLKLSMKVASGLYVGWAYVISLLSMAQRLGSPFLGMQHDFYSIVQSVIYVGLIFVGYVSVRYTSDIPFGSESKIKPKKR